MAITRMTVIKASSDADYRKGQDIFLIDKRIKNFETDINTLTDTPHDFSDCTGCGRQRT